MDAKVPAENPLRAARSRSWTMIVGGSSKVIAIPERFDQGARAEGVSEEKDWEDGTADFNPRAPEETPDRPASTGAV